MCSIECGSTFKNEKKKKKFLDVFKLVNRL